MLTRRSRSTRSSTRAGVARGATRGLISVLSLGIPLLAIAQSLTSCGSDDDDGQACEPGAPRACAVPGSSCEATQVCAADGSGYSACECPDGSGNAGSGGGGAGGSANNGGGAAGAAGANGVDNPLFDPAARVMGAPCVTDADCPVGPGGETPLVCIPATSTDLFGPGGPQGGYCSAPCTTSAFCQGLDPTSGCGLQDENDNGYCISLCIPGVDNRLKCDPNRAQSCFEIPTNPGVGACFPSCQSDAACGDGLFCDLGRTVLGLCVAEAPVGGDVGAPCTTETETDDCKSGICITLLNRTTNEAAGSFCSATCTFGLFEGCGFDNPSSVPRDAVCLQPQSQTGDLGDLGLCFELCDTAADCTQDGWECAPLNPALATELGRTGECLPPGVAAGSVAADAG